MKKLFSLMMAAFIGLTAFAAEETYMCSAGTVVDGKITYETECCTIVQMQDSAKSALVAASPWKIPVKSSVTFTPKVGVTIEKIEITAKTTTLATYTKSSTWINATATSSNTCVVTPSDGTQPIIMVGKTAQLEWKQIVFTYTTSGSTPEPEDPVTPEPEDTTVVTPEPQPTTETVYFINTKGWAKVNAYAWTTTPIVAWPGAAATKESEQIGGYDVYSYTLEAGAAANVIFNNGSQQTADLKWEAGKYFINTTWYTKEEAEAQLAKPAEYEYIYFVNVQNWAAVKIYTWTPEIAGWPGVAMTKEADQIGGYDVYSYKVDKGSVFGGMLFNNGNGTKTGDLTWTPGKYFVKDKWYTKEEAIEKLGGTTVLLPTVALAGEMNTWSTLTHELKAAEDQKTASITVQLEAQSYAFKMVVDGAWLGNTGTMTRDNCTDWVFEALDGEETNAHITADVAGDYIFTWTYETKTLTVTYPEAGENPGEEPGDDPDQPENPDTPEQPEVTTISLAGTMNEWDMTANPFVVAEGGQTASLTIALEAATYEFKVVVDNKWLTNTGEMTRDNCTGWLFENLDGMGNNAKIVADVAGDYVFVWSIADSKLSVTYPVAGEEPGDDPVDPETAVDNVAVGEKAVKVIRNGQMYIIRNGVIYNAMGQIAE